MTDRNFHINLFTDCATNCAAYEACGGYHSTAPCRCIYPTNDERRHACHLCAYNCRERGLYKPDPKLQVRSFEQGLEDGLTLAQVGIKQSIPILPAFIPEFTHRYQGDKRFEKWAAVDVQTLFKCRLHKAADIRSFFVDENAARDYLRVAPDCGLIAVLNGKDKFLESLWAAPLEEIFARLKRAGFNLCTAPTFSINALATNGAETPFSHHTTMLMRHNRVLAEIERSGMSAIPNLYTLDDDARQINDWAEWLKENPSINTISRDFTSTNHWPVVEKKLDNLKTILRLAGRPFQVLIVGTGKANAVKVATDLAAAGHQPTIITSAPIAKAINSGSKYLLNKKGELLNGDTDETMSYDEVILHNVERFSKALEIAVEKGKRAA